MSVETNKAVVLQLIADMVKNLDAIDAHPGMVPSKPFFQQMFAAFPDAGAPDIKEFVGEGDWVACRIVQRGTHRAEFMGIPATGRFAEWEVMGNWRVVDGKIVESHAQADNISLRQQLGALPPVGA
ncbi:MAG: hypothetical protein NVS2B7_35370 [Herpetosiphon sp.]